MHRPTTPGSPRLAALSALVACAWPSLALAQVPAASPERSLLPLLLALGLLLAGMIVMGIMVWLRMRQGEVGGAQHTEADLRVLRRAIAASSSLRVAARSAPPSLSVDPSGASTAVPEPGPTVYEPGPTVYDPAPMELAELVMESPSDRLDTSVNGMSCPSCQRLFDVGALYCPYDSTPLQLVEVDPSIYEVEGVELQCPSCDARYLNEGGFCPEDGGRLMPADPEVQHYPAVPVMFCTHTHNELPPGTERPEGAALLLPLTGRRTCGLPIAGPGPKRRICPECGTRYPLAASWCALDQAPLVNLN